MTDFRFLHAADIHLDSPLRGLSRYDGIPHDEVRDATRTAFDNLVQYAIDERVDFVVLAGDLFDGDWKDARTGLHFARAMGRLDRASIPVFVLAGNHDAASVLTRSVPLPDNVRRFNDRKPQTHRLEEFGVALHGQSFATSAVTENLVLGYPDASKECFNIGVLHTALAGREGHEPYAPCDVHHLRAKGYDYWALGHVHSFEIVSTEPPVIFPGNLQGRSIRETGPKGAVLVEVADRRVVAITPVEFDVMRWMVVEVDCTGLSADGVQSSMRDALSRAHSEAKPGLPILVRIVLVGRSPDAAALRDRVIDLRENARAIAVAVSPDVWIEKVRIAVDDPELQTAVELPDEFTELLAQAGTDPELSKLLDEDLALFLSTVRASFGDAVDRDELLVAASAGNWSTVLDAVIPSLRSRLAGVH